MIPKFRVWDKRKNEMYNPDELTIQINGSEIIVALASSLHQIFNYELMQSTGLKDKNGKEIFEGDVVRAEHDNFSMDEITPEYKPYIGFVKYVNTGYSIITKDAYHPCLSNIRIINIEVQGNKFENPELMEEMVE
ncbi:YopX family protein [Staphylococcus agnetis]|uniref:YopX family protein n=1 Tax=Staphylococcus agnetis TaxID=985762 RepID=UPI0039EA1286